MPNNVLHTWKEIAQYAGCGVRTVQRWELMFAMPVHRPSGQLRSSVFAFREEIDAWFRSRAKRFDGAFNGHSAEASLQAANIELRNFAPCPTCGGRGHLMRPDKGSSEGSASPNA